MQPRGISGDSLVSLILNIFLILLLAIGQPGAMASSEGDVELTDERKNMRPWTHISQEPESLQVSVGSRVELRCVAAGNPPPRIYWFSGPEAERQIRDMITRVREEGNVVPAEWEGLGELNSTYVIDCVKPEDAGYRYCVSVSNDKVAYSQPSLLLVDGSRNAITRTEECHNQPSITLNTAWKLAIQGSTVVLPCRVEGQPTSYVSWLDNMSNRIGTSAFARHAVMPNGDLRIKNLQWEDMGAYTCRLQSNNMDKSVVSFVYPLKKQA
ncbi:neural/ectodermal development factor IMP-L2 isoform X2 [Odontomachus brunneus]|uniref:neural/ectodermal development factor IMP-L2 isoform X2 n=1 Tax=Odontomachus brunneus TaxID=486640 RepID=UPI0013F1EF9F|nr:neural/ectodermal development factor IMP-L2 isoform X2 [Odontomachus brunneus]